MAIPVDVSKFYLMDLAVPAANAPELLQSKFGKKVNFAQQYTSINSDTNKAYVYSCLIFYMGDRRVEMHVENAPHPQSMMWNSPIYDECQIQ